MDPNSTLLCRLCLKQREDVVNVFDIFQNVTIDFILKQYFWLQVSRNEGLSEFLCQICWNNTKTFHIFYEEVELLQEVYWNSIGTAETNCYVEMIKEEPIETEINFDLNYVKNEDLKVEAEVIATEMNEEGSGNVASCKQVEIDAIPTKDVEKVKLPGRRRTKNGLEANNKIKVKKDKKENSQNSYEYRVNNDYLDAQLHVYFDMKCDICGDPFETYRSAQKHYRTAHNMKGYLICCGHKHHRRGRVLDHIQFHLNPSIFSCDQCSRKFATKKALTVHLEYHEPLSSRPFKCDLCPRSFPRETALNVHKDFLHCPVKCVECDMSYPSKSRLSTHMKNAHQPKVNATRVCDICAKVFVNKYTLLKHMREQHSAIKNPEVQCDICGTFLKYKSKLWLHMKRHEERVPSKCPLCGKVMENKYSLTKHMQYVHKEKKHQCSICNKSFRTRISLKEHMAVHTGQDLYECAYCPKTFKSSANMYNHRKKMHHEQLNEECDKKRSLLKNT